jgi:hypothetical protein
MMEVEALINSRKVAWWYIHPEDDGTVARLLVVMLRLRRHARSALLSHGSGNIELQLTIITNLRTDLDEVLLDSTC